MHSSPFIFCAASSRCVWKLAAKVAFGSHALSYLCVSAFVDLSQLSRRGQLMTTQESLKSTNTNTQALTQLNALVLTNKCRTSDLKAKALVEREKCLFIEPSKCI